MIAGAPSVVGKVHAEWRALRSGIVGEIAAVSSVGTLALKKVPADGDLGRVVLIHACEATRARPCKVKSD